MKRVRDCLVQDRCTPGYADARRESELLLAHVLGVSRAWLVAHADDVIDDAACAAFAELHARRARGEPVAYLTGTRGFPITRNVALPISARVPARSHWRLRASGRMQECWRPMRAMPLWQWHAR